MNGLLRETGVSFTVGQRLSSQDLNVMNDTINRLVRTVNSFLKGFSIFGKSYLYLTKSGCITVFPLKFLFILNSIMQP